MFRRPVLIATFLASLALPATAQETTREVTNVKGDVWRFQNNFHFSVFVVTEDGMFGVSTRGTNRPS